MALARPRAGRLRSPLSATPTTAPTSTTCATGSWPPRAAPRTNRSSSLTPSLSHRGEAPGKTARTPQTPMARTMTTIALETRRPVAPKRDNDAEGATSGNANPGKSVEGAEHPQRTARPPLPPRISAPAPAIPVSRRPASEALAPPRRPRPWRSLHCRPHGHATDRPLGSHRARGAFVHAIPEVVSAEAPWGICPTSDCTSPSMRQAPTSWWPSPTEAPPTAGASLALVLTAVGLGALGPAVPFESRLLRWALRPVQQAWAQQQQFIADASTN